MIYASDLAVTTAVATSVAVGAYLYRDTSADVKSLNTDNTCCRPEIQGLRRLSATRGVFMRLLLVGPLLG